jgi:hypothetical protein
MLVVVILIGVYLVGNLTGAAVSVLPNLTTTKIPGTSGAKVNFVYPDIVISDISWAYQQQGPAAGGQAIGYTVTVTVKNQGQAPAANFEVMTKDITNNIELFPPNPQGLQKRCIIALLQAGQTAKCGYIVPIPHALPFQMPFTIQATADSPQNLFGAGLGQIGVVRESNENNNVLSAKVNGCDLAIIGKCRNGKCEKAPAPKNNCPDRSETTYTCFQDCVKCGDGICNDPEKIVNGFVGEMVYKWACKADCGYIWGDGTCDKGEAGTEGAFLDCGKCGDGVCDINEFNDTASMKASTFCKANPKFCKVCAADC